MELLMLIGLVRNVIQFISVGHELFTSIRDFHLGGNWSAIAQLKLIVGDIRRSNQEIFKFLGEELILGGQIWQDPPKEIDLLQSIATECERIASQLLGLLDRFKVKSTGLQRKLESFKVSIGFLEEKGHWRAENQALGVRKPLSSGGFRQCLDHCSVVNWIC
ncbi:hypothetical protein F5Y16DRAFT_386734 [Xylariaceae sp. FL0255]|nr:hypothetical protein F5Y16DRAFT_386734 [Xylariaceae sp. FL0255]